MINSEFIIKYTDALYSTPSENAPRYEEFRDMFSSGQIRSKEWIIQELLNLGFNYTHKKILITGCWFGTLGLMINNKFPKADVIMLDIDPRCEKFIQSVIYENDSMSCITEDMYNHEYSEDFIINTSCEHMPDIGIWLDRIPSGKIVILQSNNYHKGNGHINSVDNLDMFRRQVGLSHILYSGELKFPMYNRYMIIGTK
jgi:hypothetical protein